MLLTGKLAHSVIDFLVFTIFLYSILSWFRLDKNHPISRLLHLIVDPLLYPVSLVLPNAFGMDFSPVVTTLILWALQKIIDNSFNIIK